MQNIPTIQSHFGEGLCDFEICSCEYIVDFIDCNEIKCKHVLWPKRLYVWMCSYVILLWLAVT